MNMISKFKSLYGKVAGAITGAFIFLTVKANEALASLGTPGTQDAGDFKEMLNKVIDVAMYLGYALIIVGIVVVVIKYLFPGDGHEKPSKSLINWGLGVTIYFVALAFLKWYETTIGK